MTSFTDESFESFDHFKARQGRQKQTAEMGRGVSSLLGVSGWRFDACRRGRRKRRGESEREGEAEDGISYRIDSFPGARGSSLLLRRPQMSNAYRSIGLTGWLKLLSADSAFQPIGIRPPRKSSPDFSNARPIEVRRISSHHLPTSAWKGNALLPQRAHSSTILFVLSFLQVPPQPFQAPSYIHPQFLLLLYLFQQSTSCSFVSR